MDIRLANKLLWKKSFASVALPSFGVECKTKPVPTHTPFATASPENFNPGSKFALRAAAVLLCTSVVATEARAERFSINDAISQAVLTNPGVGEASANRRATETELRQTQSTLLPQVRLEARIGPERFTQDITPPPIGNGQWLSGKSGSVVVRQLLFDGLASIHDIWRQAARVNAASFRVRERSELTALDAAEAYIDVVRFLRLVALADQNVANHEELFSHVKSRYAGGLAGEGDLQQALERVEAAKAAHADFQRSLDDARAKYRNPIVPARVVVWNAGFPACVPSASPGPREARRPASNTWVPAPPGAGMLPMLGAEPMTVDAGALKSCACAKRPNPAPVSAPPGPNVPGVSCVISASGGALPGRASIETSRKSAPLDGSAPARMD